MMPLVFVHGVANRQSPEQQIAVAQRDALFKRLVTSEDDPIFDPDWGSNGVKFARGGWVPEPGVTEAFAMGTPLAGQKSVAAALASRDVDRGIDLAFVALLLRRVSDKKSLADDDLRAFGAAVTYLEKGGDHTAFSSDQTDTQFSQTLDVELSKFLPGAQIESMALGGVFSAIGNAVKWVTDPLRNAGSDAVLRLLRKPLSAGVALFLGDVFVYLRWRETDAAAGTYNRIFAPIIEDLAKANAARSSDRGLILVGHSLGAVILYDLLTDAHALADVEAKSGRPLLVDAWVSVGAQPGLFADMGLYAGVPGADGKLSQPSCVRQWMNVFDFTDVLSFRAMPFFSGVDDFEFDNVTGVLEAHSAYFQRPSFYKRLRARLSTP
jgi:hypothetical protein